MTWYLILWHLITSYLSLGSFFALAVIKTTPIACD